MFYCLIVRLDYLVTFFNVRYVAFWQVFQLRQDLRQSSLLKESTGIWFNYPEDWMAICRLRKAMRVSDIIRYLDSNHISPDQRYYHINKASYWLIVTWQSQQNNTEVTKATFISNMANLDIHVISIVSTMQMTLCGQRDWINLWIDKIHHNFLFRVAVEVPRGPYMLYLRLHDHVCFGTNRIKQAS